MLRLGVLEPDSAGLCPRFGCWNFKFVWNPLENKANLNSKSRGRYCRFTQRLQKKWTRSGSGVPVLATPKWTRKRIRVRLVAIPENGSGFGSGSGHQNGSQNGSDNGSETDPVSLSLSWWLFSVFWRIFRVCHHVSAVCQFVTFCYFHLCKY